VRRIELVLDGSYVEAGVQFPLIPAADRIEIARAFSEGHAPFPDPFVLASARSITLIECDRETLAGRAILVAEPKLHGILASKNRGLLGLRAFRALAFAALLGAGGAFVTTDALLLAAEIALPRGALAGNKRRKSPQPWVPGWFWKAWSKARSKKS
jgi:hypothetical protein